MFALTVFVSFLDTVFIQTQFEVAGLKARGAFIDQRLTARHRREISLAERHSCNGSASTVTGHIPSRTFLGYAKTADILA